MNNGIPSDKLFVAQTKRMHGEGTTHPISFKSRCIQVAHMQISLENCGQELRKKKFGEVYLPHKNTGIHVVRIVEYGHYCYGEQG